MNTDDLVAFCARAVVASNVHEKLALEVCVDAAQIKSATGIDVCGYLHVLDNFGLKHGFKHHGNESLEAPRGQRAVSVSDVLRIQDTLKSPDSITFDGYSRHSRQPVIGFEKNFGVETLVYKAEVRKGKKELATQTFYIRRGK